MKLSNVKEAVAMIGSKNQTMSTTYVSDTAVSNEGTRGLDIAQTAAVLADWAIQAHMNGFGTDRKTAACWLRTAIDLLSDQDELAHQLEERSS
jgi:hypothetical protein